VAHRNADNAGCTFSAESAVRRSRRDIKKVVRYEVPGAGEKRVPSRQPRKSFGARGRSKLFSSAPDLLPPQLGI
jgi:hypothetical protein